LVRVLIKARFLDSQATDLKSKTVLLTTVNQQTYVENFSSLGAIGNRRQTDGRTDDTTISNYYFLGAKQELFQ
jgi:hypothetical protein